MKAHLLLLAAMLLAGCGIRDSARHAYGDGKRQLGFGDRERQRHPPGPEEALCPLCQQQGCSH